MYGYNLGLAKARVSESIPAAPANVVLPSLVGNGAVGSVVTCSPGAWSGSPSPTFTFNFKLDTVSVQSGASNTYTPLIGDDTKTLTCTVTATNTEGSANADTSNSLVIGTAPSNTVAPVISGTNTFGNTLTTTNGTFTGTAPLTYTYQWLRGGSPITGETLSTYVIGSSDSLAAITCEVKATNSYGFDSEVSNTITVQDFAPINTVAPTVSPSGTQSTGTLITANVGTWTGVAPITYEYKWTRNGVAISGATASTYTIQLADDGTTIRVEVKGTNTYGTSAFIASSNSVSAVNTVAPTNSVAPVISGTAVVGQVLTSTTGTWSGIPTPTYSYQWKRGATNIGTNASTYTLVQADAGNTSNITCVVTATNAGGSANATSNQIAQILDANMKAWLIDSLAIQNNSTTYFTSTRQRTGTQLVTYYNDFFIGLKTQNIYTAIRAMYRPRFANANLNKFNMVNPLDTNGAYRMTYSGTWAYNETGEVPNGTNAFATTNLAVNVMSQNSIAIGVDINTNGTTGNRVDVANLTDSSLYISARYDANPILGNLISNVNNTGLKVVTNSGVQAMWIASRTTSTERLVYKNSTLIDTFTAVSTAPVTGSICFGRSSLGEFSDRGQRFRIVSDGLNGTQVTALNTLLSTLTTFEGI